MAASDPHPRPDSPPRAPLRCLPAAALLERLEEEIQRAERQGTHLSCLLVAMDELEEMAGEHGAELREQTLDYVSRALGRELRCFDRIGRTGEGELLIVLPGTDSPRSEIVARRVLNRLRTIKVEAGGERSPLNVAVGLAAWREQTAAEQLLRQSRSAARLGNGERLEDEPEGHPPLTQARAQPASVPALEGLPSARWRPARS
jgi:diguanylate cyclase (GGDEF)-like protein